MRFTSTIFMAVVLVCVAQLYGQSPPDKLNSPEQSAHIHNDLHQKSISGAEHPELIPDATAYRLFFLAIAPPSASEPNANQLTSFRQTVHQKLGFSTFDGDSFSQTMADFRADYDVFIKKYNDAAAIAFKDGGAAPDYVTLLKERDSIVQKTRDRLKNTLSSQGSSQLDVLVQSEKRHMTVPAGQ